MAYNPINFFTGNLDSVAGDKVLYTVPAGQTAIVTHWSLSPSNGACNAYLYLGNSSLGILEYDFPGIGNQNNSTEWKGMYVVHAGETIIWGGAGGQFAYQSVSGLVGSGTIGGKTPARIGTVAPNTTGDFTINAGPNGAIVKSILVSNYSGSSPAVAVRLGAAPIAEWYGPLQPAQVKKYNMSHRMYANESITINSSIANTIRATVYGWLL